MTMMVTASHIKNVLNTCMLTPEHTSNQQRERRYPTQERRPNSRFRDNYLLTVETAEFEPETFDQAIQHKGWEIAIDQEMDSITRN